MAFAVNDNEGCGTIHVTGTHSAATESLFTDRRKIRQIYWYQPTNAGHFLVILNGARKTFVKAIAETNDVSVPIPMYGQETTGMRVTTMTSGELFVYYFKA